MNYLIHLANSYLLLFLLPLCALIAWYRWYFYKKPSLIFPVTHVIAKKIKSSYKHETVLFLLRLATLLVLSLLISKPQLVDTTTKMHVNGVDIMLVLDVSRSMLLFDDLHNPKSRIDTAKNEALRFIDKRESDLIGLVLFGQEAVSRCPLTLDKGVLRDIINGTQIGIVPDEGTMLAKGMIVAASRLKHSQAKSKIMILLTDGEPSENDTPAQQSIEIARQLGIKVYCIGIGNIEGGYFKHPQVGLIPYGSNLNRSLLQQIAYSTGGRYFEAAKQEELRAIYDQIDKLEKTEYDTTIFTNRYDIFIPFVWLLIVMLLFEIVATSFIWFSL
jgi:Ca-activated chloride channel family protein